MADITRGGGLMGWAAVALVVAGGCAPPEREPGDVDTPIGGEPTYAVAGRPIETDDGMYLLTFTPPETGNFAWPTYPGRTRMNVTVAAGPSFAEEDDEDVGFETDMPAYPLKLTFDAVTPPEAAIGASFFPEAWATRSDGTAWTVAVDFTAPGEWIMPITVADIEGHVDRARVGFKVKGEPGQGKPVMFR